MCGVLAPGCPVLLVGFAASAALAITFVRYESTPIATVENPTAVMMSGNRRFTSDLVV